MTVNVMTADSEAVLPRESVSAAPAAAEPDSAVSGKPLVYMPEESAFEIPSVRFKKQRRRSERSFGSIVFVQLVISGVLAAALWAGNTFGTGEVSEICAGIADLFR